MQKFTRKERIIYLTALFTKNPGILYPLNDFCSMFGSARSSISEDISMIDETFRKNGMGEIKTKPGKNGGVKYIPFMNLQGENEFLKNTCELLKDPMRILPGGYIYMIDVLLEPEKLKKIGSILASRMSHLNPDYIVTAETKGISVALAVADIFKKPIVIAGRHGKLTEGSIVTVNYLSGSTKKLQTISISKRAIKPKSNVIVIDDFISGGGTVKAICDMMAEFESKVLSVGCVISTKYPEKKKVADFISLFTLEEVDEENQNIRLFPHFR